MTRIWNSCKTHYEYHWIIMNNIEYLWMILNNSEYQHLDAYCLRYNNKRIAELNAEKQDPVYTARASRLEGWKQLVQQAQAELRVPIAPPERLMSFSWFGLIWVDLVYYWLCMIMYDYDWSCMVMYGFVVSQLNSTDLSSPPESLSRKWQNIPKAS